MAQFHENLLHIYAQEAWHCEARIIGSSTALVSLRDAIGRALEKGRAQFEAMTADGEGYPVEVEKDDTDWLSGNWKDREMPYVADYARGVKNGATESESNSRGVEKPA